MATKVSQKPKITRKSAAKPSKIGGGAKGVQHVRGLAQQKAHTGKGGKGHGSVSTTNKMPSIVEYPGEGRGKSFKGVKIVGAKG
jgi:hypothetical protein